MGDGLPAFAPQWLKSGPTLGAGGHAKEGWRGGSKAGAGQDASQQGVAETWLFGDRLLPGKDRASWLSQAPPLQLRPAGRSDALHSPRIAEPNGYARKLRPAPVRLLHKPAAGIPHYRDAHQPPTNHLPTSPAHPAVVSSPACPVTSPPPVERPVDKPSWVTKAEPADGNTTSQPPRMADAILQKQAAAAQDAAAQEAARARLQTLALRQSKQLVPVVASGGKTGKLAKKAAPESPASRRPLAPAPAAQMSPLRSTGKVALGVVARASHANERPSPMAVAEEAPKGVTSPSQPGTPPSGGLARLGSLQRTGRSSFFETLRRQSSGASMDKVGQSSSNASEAASLPDAPPEPQTNGSVTAEEKKEAAALDKEVPLGSQMSAEEEAFLISLGWQAADSDEEEGLTEEEIAAFQRDMEAAGKKRALLSRTSGKGVLKAAWPLNTKWPLKS